MEGKVVCKLASKMDKRTNIPVNSGYQVGTPSFHSIQCIRKLNLSVHVITQTTGLSVPQKCQDCGVECANGFNSLNTMCKVAVLNF